MQTPLAGGVIPLGTLFDSELFVASANFQTQEVIMPAITFDFENNTYWVEVTLIKNTTTDQPGISLIHVNQQ
jgi:hypothetical protein